jgi:hypothetical protein
MRRRGEADFRERGRIMLSCGKKKGFDGARDGI